MTNKEYYELDFTSQSFLKKVLEGPAAIYAYNNRGDFIANHFIVGSAIDCLITTPTMFDEEFIIYKEILPPDDICKLLGIYYNETEDTEIVDEDLLLEISYRPLFGKGNDKAYDLRTKKRESRLAKFTDDKATNYYGTLATGKKLITESLLEVINNSVYQLTKNSYTAYFFKLPDQFEINYQVALVDYDKKRKGLLDMVITNTGDEFTLVNGYVFPANSTLIIDIKTGAYGPGKLKEYIDRWNIKFQLSWYKDFYQKQYSGTKLLNPVILYSHQNKHSSYSTWYEFTDQELLEGREQYKEALSLLKLYQSQEQWTVPAKIYRDLGRVA